MNKRLWTILLLFYTLNGQAQDWTWWNNLVDWDGKTPWQEYLQLSSSGLGPNALPVPSFQSLAVQKGFRFQSEIRYHHYKEDPTVDYQFRINYGFDDRIGIAIWMVPVEYYNTSIALRDQRKLRALEPSGFASGDLYFGTYFHLLQETDERPDVMISANLKTASGNNLEAGRSTDTPGYYFDALIAKTYGDFRPYLAAGIYVYQTFDGLHFQNDAFLYGLGLHYIKPNYRLQTEWAGYYGYLDIGDRPSVLRGNIDLKISENHALTASTQFAVNDLKYHTFSLGYVYLYSK